MEEEDSVIRCGGPITILISVMRWNSEGEGRHTSRKGMWFILSFAVRCILIFVRPEAGAQRPKGDIR